MSYSSTGLLALILHLLINRLPLKFQKNTDVLFNRNQDGMVARPGCSEHQTGLALDIAQVVRGMSLDDAHTAWLAENCWEYGFVVRYPEGREDMTGIPAERWHLRYVGRDAALEMHERNWVLEEWHEAHQGA